MLVLHLSNDVELARVGVEPAYRRAVPRPLRGDDLVVDHVGLVRQNHVPETRRRQREALTRRVRRLLGQRHCSLVERVRLATLVLAGRLYRSISARNLDWSRMMTGEAW